MDRCLGTNHFDLNFSGMESGFVDNRQSFSIRSVIIRCDLENDT